MSLAAAAAHHVTLIFGTVLFAVPVLWVAFLDARDGRARGAARRRLPDELSLFAVVVAIGVGVVLLPYWMTLIQHPIHQIPIPHDSRNNFLLNSITGINYFVIPYGALILALPFIFLRGASVPPAAAAAVRLLADVDFRLGRHDAAAEMAAGTRLRDSDLRALHLLGDADGHADRRPAGDCSCLSASERKLRWALALAAVATIGAALCVAER